MPVWSKLTPKVEGLSCRDLLHPWTDNCLLAGIHNWVDCCIGSAKFFALLYLCQYVSAVLKRKKKVGLKKYLQMHIRSTAFAATVATGTFMSHCFFRKLLGSYYYYSLVFFPAFLGGCAIFLESRKGRELYVNAFANCALELWIRLLESSKILKWNPNVQTVVFMVLSSVLSSLLSCTSFDLNYFWFFIPPSGHEIPKQDDSNGVCFHKENCKKHISRLFVTYSTTGLVLQLLRLLMSNFKTPKLLFPSLRSPKTFKLAAFLGAYVVIYQTIRCFLYQREKKYSLIHDVLAGFLAGVAFRFQPTIPIFNSAIITTVQILTEALYRRKLLPNIPYLEIMFAFSYGLLVHSRVLLSEHCPQFLINIISSATHGMSDRVTHSILIRIKKISDVQSGILKCSGCSDILEGQFLCWAQMLYTICSEMYLRLNVHEFNISSFL